MASLSTAKCDDPPLRLVDGSRRSETISPGHNGSLKMSQPDRILRIRTVLERTALSRSTLYRKVNDGTFPRQVRISEHCAGWQESLINEWIADPAGWRPEEGGRRD